MLLSFKIAVIVIFHSKKAIVNHKYEGCIHVVYQIMILKPKKLNSGKEYVSQMDDPSFNFIETQWILHSEYNCKQAFDASLRMSCIARKAEVKGKF